MHTKGIHGLTTTSYIGWKSMTDRRWTTYYKENRPFEASVYAAEAIISSQYDGMIGGEGTEQHAVSKPKHAICQSSDSSIDVSRCPMKARLLTLLHQTALPSRPSLSQAVLTGPLPSTPHLEFLDRSSVGLADDIDGMLSDGGRGGSLGRVKRFVPFESSLRFIYQVHERDIHIKPRNFVHLLFLSVSLQSSVVKV